MTYELKVSFNEIINITCANHKVANKQGLRDAYEYAEKKHAGVLRGTGEPYLNHPLRTARLVAEWGFESDVIMAAMLHDVVEDCNTPLSEIEKKFGSNVASIVDAVTALSDRDFSDPGLTKAEKDLMSDALLQKKMNLKALYVKIADRIDNLSTLSGVPEQKRIPKAEHTRDIIIPMARLAKAWHFADVLEELCFQTEHPQMYEGISERYQELCRINSRTCQESLDILANTFDPHFNTQASELDRYHRYIRNYQSSHRTYNSIYRKISRMAENIKSDWSALFNKDNFALYDLVLVVSNELADENSALRPHDIFFRYFDAVLSARGFSLLKFDYTTYRDSGFFVLADGMDNLFRFFVRTELEQQRYMLGSIVDEDSSLSLSDINEIEPRDTYNEKIKVFRRDGSAMLIDKSATVLDFAFYIHSDLGIHFEYAMVDDSRTQLPAYTRLNEGDTITVVARDEIRPSIYWFNYVKTSKAVHFLVRYFQQFIF